MEQWAYHLIPVDETAIQSLNFMGKTGWRLVPGTVIAIDQVDYLIAEHNLLESR